MEKQEMKMEIPDNLVVDRLLSDPTPFLEKLIAVNRIKLKKRDFNKYRSYFRKGKKPSVATPIVFDLHTDYLELRDLTLFPNRLFLLKNFIATCTLDDLYTHLHLAELSKRSVVAIVQSVALEEFLKIDKLHIWMLAAPKAIADRAYADLHKTAGAQYPSSDRPAQRVLQLAGSPVQLLQHILDYARKVYTSPQFDTERLVNRMISPDYYPVKKQQPLAMKLATLRREALKDIGREIWVRVPGVVTDKLLEEVWLQARSSCYATALSKKWLTEEDGDAYAEAFSLPTREEFYMEYLTKDEYALGVLHEAAAILEFSGADMRKERGLLYGNFKDINSIDFQKLVDMLIKKLKKGESKWNKNLQ